MAVFLSAAERLKPHKTEPAWPTCYSADGCVGQEVHVSFSPWKQAARPKLRKDKITPTPLTFSYSLRDDLFCVCVCFDFFFFVTLRAKGFLSLNLFPGPTISGQHFGWCLAWTSKQESQGVNDTGIVLWGLISSEYSKEPLEGTFLRLVLLFSSWETSTALLSSGTLPFLDAFRC